jgi:RNA polymerase sigma factor (sigma-70 family)
MTEVEQQSDGQLLTAFAETGDEAAFAVIVRRHGTMVQGACLRVLRDFHEAQDVTQAVFLTLARKAARLRKDPSVGGWLHHVATCLARNARSAGQSRKRREEESMQTTTSVAPGTALHALREELDHAVEQLPARYRLPLMLFHFEEQSLEETARVLGLKASAASARLVRGREMLRAKLVRRGVAVGSVGALTVLLSAEAGAAVLPATFVSATVEGAALAAAGQLGAGVGTGAVSAKVAALTKGAETMLFIGQVKSVAAGVAIGVAVAGAGLGVGAAVAANNGREAAAPPPTAAVQTPSPVKKEAAPFSSRAWRNDEASRDLARAGIRVFSIGGWGVSEAVDWATPAELRRRPMPAADYVNAWAASREREVLWLSDAKVTVMRGASLRLDPTSEVAVIEGGVTVELPGNSLPITGKRAEYHQKQNTLMVDGVSVPLPAKNVAIIGTKAELDALRQRAGGDTASAEAILAKLGPNAGPPPVEPEPDQAGLRKTFNRAQGKAKADAAILLCAAGGDDGLEFLQAELSRKGAITREISTHGHSWTNEVLEALGAHGGPEAIEELKTFLSSKQASLQWRAGLALGRNASAAAVEVLQTALKSDDADTAHGAACSLEVLGGKPGLELAALALTHGDPKVRRTGAFGAYRAHGERALPLMEKALADADAGVRNTAVSGLANIGGDRARDLIRRQLTIEKDPDVLKALQDAQRRIENR